MLREKFEEEARNYKSRVIIVNKSNKNIPNFVITLKIMACNALILLSDLFKI